MSMINSFTDDVKLSNDSNKHFYIKLDYKYLSIFADHFYHDEA